MYIVSRPGTRLGLLLPLDDKWKDHLCHIAKNIHVGRDDHSVVAVANVVVNVVVHGV